MDTISKLPTMAKTIRSTTHDEVIPIPNKPGDVAITRLVGDGRVPNHITGLQQRDNPGALEFLFARKHAVVAQPRSVGAGDKDPEERCVAGAIQRALEDGLPRARGHLRAHERGNGPLARVRA